VHTAEDPERAHQGGVQAQAMGVDDSSSEDDEEEEDEFEEEFEDEEYGGEMGEHHRQGKTLIEF
jgi:hypothetical protein